MPQTATDIISSLQQQLLPLQGIHKMPPAGVADLELGPLLNAFPGGRFPLGAVHEFCCPTQESAAATAGFISGILSPLMKKGGTTFWVSSSRTLFPPAFARFNIQPEHIIFVDTPREKDRLWVLEEALKCNGLAAVVGEVEDLSFTASRRLQLAVEQSRVTGFLLRRQKTAPGVTACVTRWQISPVASSMPEPDMPGVGYPRWQVSLLKVRNGRPGNWQVEWAAGRFRYTPASLLTAYRILQRKTG